MIRNEWVQVSERAFVNMDSDTDEITIQIEPGNGRIPPTVILTKGEFDKIVEQVYGGGVR